MLTLPPLLTDLQQRLTAHCLSADAREIAGVILEIAREQGWTTKPERLNAWLVELALEVARTPIPRRHRP